MHTRRRNTRRLSIWTALGMSRREVMRLRGHPCGRLRLIPINPPASLQLWRISVLSRRGISPCWLLLLLLLGILLILLLLLVLLRVLLRVLRVLLVLLVL